MPNWCCGDLKIRGHIDDVKKFLDESIYQGGSITKNGDELELDNVSGHINGTRRCFIDSEYTECFYEDDNHQIIVVIPTEHAWGPYLQEFQVLSREFNVDFRFYGFERGGKFNCEFEILKGELTLNRIIGFNDYDWECPHPLMGG
ncbi:hypothetical protein SAMN05660772_02738 [Pasteurella testudinis DSM 23072]|uniref:YubB ferredoxin-like domain-containing protein n=1 Tax=Pasteurella testudinis DSM 23072 TaxID=1122938 RepID=A0A1W1V335_9PAST|nr:hypothetical protein [Pasteurella testudinis]SMB87797.1 hypothetical protein SAMN05660772_02738 [Pasteurella testudinis DSM 23072]SUB51596.1 Uncharacterised protein [Pasteurella testudinis]